MARIRSSVARPAARVAVLGRDDGDERRPVAAPVCGRRRAPDAVDLARAPSRRPRGRPSGRARRRARAGRCRCPSPRASRGRRAPARRCASESARGFPSWIEEAATTSAPSTAVDATAAAQRWRTTRRAQADQARLARASRRLRGQSSLGPIVASRTGSSVTATATLTSAISRPAMPMLRRNGTGRTTSASSEIATVVPLKTTAEPACCIAFRTACSFVTFGAGAPRASGPPRAARSRSRCRARSARRGTGRSPTRR